MKEPNKAGLSFMLAVIMVIGIVLIVLLINMNEAAAAPQTIYIYPQSVGVC